MRLPWVEGRLGTSLGIVCRLPGAPIVTKSRPSSGGMPGWAKSAPGAAQIASKHSAAITVPVVAAGRMIDRPRILHLRSETEE